ncbi:hypothetical protein AB0E63_12275 [Kribbella sp. NPDC026596]|uniref:hypothetical protein n=1 Tax=Kribbella sp. NPDC026596 TaxID=3155122 RepID=UPI0033DEC478
MSAPVTEQPLHRVCVWFGAHLIIDHVSDPAYAARFEDVMRRRFASLQVTNEEAAGQ